MKSSRQILDKLSNHNYQNASHPRFGKDVDVLYAKGYTKGFTWVDEICDYYFNIEKNLVDELREHLEKKLEEIESLRDSRYKDGLQESIANAVKALSN